MRWGLVRGIALGAALAVGVSACVTKRTGDRPSVPVSVAASYGDCAAAQDGPSCLLLRAIAAEGVDAEVLVRTVVESGSVDIALKHRAALAAMRGKLETIFASEPASIRYLSASSEDGFAAALAVAAAAQIADDPFSLKSVKPLVAKAGRGETAALAAIVWREVAFGILWNARLMRPRGWSAIWRAVIAGPPKDTVLLVALAKDANLLGLEDEAVALARVAVARTDASEADRAAAHAIIALSEYAPTADLPYDAAGMKERLETCWGYGWCSTLLAEAAATGTTGDLKVFGSDLASRARRETIAKDKTIAYGAASEAFRLAGEIPAALAVAREGMRFVPAAMVIPEKGRIEAAMAAGTFAVDDDPVAPAIALYRAGARDEALRSGYLNGYARFRHAAVAGETPDPRWAIADKSDFTIWRFIYELIETPMPATATKLYDGLRCSGTTLADVIEPHKFEGYLAVLAALTGRAGSMRAHLTTAAVSLDDKAQIIPAYYAHGLAGEWRRALVIAERTGAKDDALTAPSCGASS